MPELGELIRYHRGRAGMTQERLAERAGVSPTTVVRVENGEIRQPRIATLQKLAAALRIDAGELYKGAAPPPAGDLLEVGGVGMFTAVYQRDGDWWIGYVEELPGANAQERTLEKARESLKEAVADILEANRELTRTEFEGREVVREPLEVPL
jgi:transcriptional regulator with XRE-family HTH domain